MRWPQVRRAVGIALGVVLIVLGLFDYHVQTAQIVVGGILVGGGTLDGLISLIRGPRPSTPDSS